MNAQNVLAGLLAAQIALAGLTWWPRNTSDVAPRPILPFEVGAIREVTIASSTTRSKGSPLELVSDGTSWKIASAFDYPADPVKVQEMLDKVETIRLGRPVATSAASHDQLNVGATNATRQVTVESEAGSVDFYVGTSGSSRSFVRIAGEDAVYEVAGLGAWSVRDTPNGYFDGEWVKIDADTLGSWTLTNAAGVVELSRAADGTWTAAGLPEGAVLSQQAVDDLLAQTLTLSTTAPMDPALLPRFDGPEARSVRWTARDGSSPGGGYRVIADEGGIVGLLDGSQHPVRMGSPKVRKAIEETTLEALLVAPTPPP